MTYQAGETPRIYCGTYGKYNAGSIAGRWIDLDDYAGDADGFYEACRELHKDEADPELMFQDFECFPRALYGECSLDARLWEWLELDEADRARVACYWEHCDREADVDTAREAAYYSGRNKAEIAEDYWRDTGYGAQLDALPSQILSAIDWDSVARDMEHGDWTFIELGMDECIAFIG